jgi:hypothetical protein
VARETVDDLPPEVRILRVQAGGGWACAVVDRSRPVAVDRSLLRQAVASDAADCPDCAPLLASAAAPAPAAAAEGDEAPVGQVHAAAIALQGRRMLVVLAGLDVVRSPGEADMLAADLRTRYGGVDIVLMGQEDDGTPVYHGDADLLELLADVPVDKMPWKVYPMG